MHTIIIKTKESNTDNYFCIIKGEYEVEFRVTKENEYIFILNQNQSFLNEMEDNGFCLLSEVQSYNKNKTIDLSRFTKKANPFIACGADRYNIYSYSQHVGTIEKDRIVVFGDLAIKYLAVKKISKILELPLFEMKQKDY